MIKLAVIADDLTGANDTAVQFAKRNMKASVKLDMRKIDDNETDVLVIDSNSRDLEPEEAYAKVKSICLKLAEHNISCIYKKIDSTMRGNIGTEIKAIEDVLKPKLVIIAPAYPANNRITVGGYHLLNGMPLEYTEMAHMTKSSIKNSYIPDILKQQADKKIGLLDLRCINKGKDEIVKKINEFLSVKINWLVCDAVQADNFVQLMEALKTYENILWVGSAGLADYLKGFYGWQGQNNSIVKKSKGSVLIVAGSISSVTQEQIKDVLDRKKLSLVKINVKNALMNSVEEKEKLTAKLQYLIGKNQSILLTAAVNDSDVKEALRAGKEHGLDTESTSEYIACFLAKAAAELKIHQLAGMVLTGGDTAVHICREIGADGIEIIDEIEPGVPMGRLCGRPDGMFVVTKAGAFGSKEVFTKAIDTIQN